MKFALLSDFGLELVADLFRPDDDVWTPSGFGAGRQVCLEPPADLAAFAPDLVALLLEDDGASAGETGALADCLRRKMPGTAVVRVDLADLAAGIGPDFFDARIRALAGCPWSLAGQRAIVGEVRRLAALRSAPPKKVLAVDFDGTLWRGTLAEDGVEALEPAVDFQRGLLALKKRGILLVGLTKNAADDVAAVWTHPRMVLRADDFVAIRADWREKGENLASVARALRLGTDSFVFADDNPGECAAMSASHPEVAVFPVTAPDAAAARRLTRLHFPDFGVTDEDLRRTASYRADAARRSAGEGLTLDDYLASLGTSVDFHRARRDEIPRLAQLSRRCNQFNVRQSRYSEADVARLADDPSRLVYAVSVRDRFGDLGVVALLVLARSGTAARLEEWVMSCRAMNRRIEDETWARLGTALRDGGVTSLEAAVRPTERNAPIHDLFARLGPGLVPRDAGPEAARKMV